MTEAELFTSIIEFSARLALEIILLFLFLDQRKRFDELNKAYREDMRRKEEEHVDTLKDIAGIRSNMSWVQGVVNRESDTRPRRPAFPEGDE